MWFKLMLILVIRGSLCEKDMDMNMDMEMMDSMVDSLMHVLGVNFLPVGLRFDEDMNNLQNVCQKRSGTFYEENIVKVRPMFKNTSLLVIESVSKLSSSKFSLCQLIANGESSKAAKMIKEFNKHVDQAEILCSQLSAALVEAGSRNSNITFPVLTCYLKSFNEKYLAIYPDTDGAKAMAKGLIEFLIKAIDILESAKGKSADKCELPAPPPKENRSSTILGPLMKTIHCLDKRNK